MRQTALRVFAALTAFCAATLPAAADVLCDKGSGDEAIAACSRVIRRNPSLAAGYNNRGVAYNGKQDYDRAIADYDQAIRLNPKYAGAYNNRGWAYFVKHDYDRAIADYDQAIRIKPNFALAYDNRGELRTRTGDYDRAIVDLDQAIRLDPSDADAYSSRGYAYGRKGDFARAMDDLNKALKLNPRRPLGYGNRAAILELHGDLDRAIADAGEAIRLDSARAFAWYWRARAYFDKANYALAIADSEQALRLDPLLVEARENLEHAQVALVAREMPPRSPVAASVAPPAVTTALPVTTAPVSAERRVALVIGNSGYKTSAAPSLPNPRRDARLVADTLRQAGFETVEMEDLDLAGMVNALRTFRAKADNADWALVYYAGHGIEINRMNYLIPVDAKLADSRDVKHETVSYDDIADAIGGARALRIIILDACRDNPFKAQMRQTVALRGSLERGLAAPPEAEPGTLTIYSAKEGEGAVDGDGDNSPFALAFVTRVKVPGREVQRMFDDVSDDVLEATGHRQHPYKYGRLPGGPRDFYFVVGK